ncbi:hypothetical protein MRX96_014268 [Rhipicephalus microplus]
MVEPVGWWKTGFRMIQNDCFTKGCPTKASPGGRMRLQRIPQFREAVDEEGLAKSHTLVEKPLARSQ